MALRSDPTGEGGSTIHITADDREATLAVALQVVEFLIREHGAEVARLDTANSFVFHVRLRSEDGPVGEGSA
jgi:hypothetical protein